MSSIATADHLQSLESLARRYPIDLEAVIAVPSVREWKLAHGLQEVNTRRAATIVQLESSRWLVVLAQEISPSVQRSIVNGIQARGFFDEADVLASPTHFMRHLVLHELSHALHPSGSEEFHDEWAFGELGASNA
jgi:hypothetical protein